MIALTSTWYELALLAALLAAIGWVMCDIYWTGLRSDQEAATHFLKASTRRKIAYFIVAILVVIAIVGWVR